MMVEWERMRRERPTSGRVLGLVTLLMSSSACTTDVAVAIEVSSTGCEGRLRDESVALVWGVSEGECGVRPGPVVYRGTVEEMQRVALAEGRYCFWALAMGDDCRVLAGASTSRRLPSEGARVELRLDDESCVDARNETSWDGAAEGVARCAPTCSVRRCSCSNAPSCGSASVSPDAGVAKPEEAICPSPLVGDIVAVSASHACVGSRGDDSIWCWEVGTAVEGRPQLVDLPAREGFELGLAELAIGAGQVCVVMTVVGDGSDAAADYPIWCRGLGADVESSEWIAMSRGAGAGECNMLGGGGLVDELVVGGTTGDPFVCARIATNPSTGARQGIGCWGNHPLLSDGTFDSRCVGDSGPYRGPYRLQRGALALAAGDARLCLIDTDGQLDCVGTPADWPCFPGPDTPALDVVASRDVACVVDGRLRLCCSNGVEREGVLRASIFAGGGDYVVGCIERRSGAPICAGLSGDVNTGAIELTGTLSAVAGPQLACGLGAGGVVRCEQILRDGMTNLVEVGTRYASPGENLVCPER